MSFVIFVCSNNVSYLVVVSGKLGILSSNSTHISEPSNFLPVVIDRSCVVLNTCLFEATPKKKMTLNQTTSNILDTSLFNFYEKLRLALAVLNATFLQSGKMLTELGDNSNEEFWKVTTTVFSSSLFTRKAAHSPELRR